MHRPSKAYVGCRYIGAYFVFHVLFCMVTPLFGAEGIIASQTFGLMFTGIAAVAVLGNSEKVGRPGVLFFFFGTSILTFFQWTLMLSAGS